MKSCLIRDDVINIVSKELISYKAKMLLEEYLRLMIVTFDHQIAVEQAMTYANVVADVKHVTIMAALNEHYLEDDDLDYIKGAVKIILLRSNDDDRLYTYI